MKHYKDHCNDASITVKNRWVSDNQKRVFKWRWKVCSDDDETASGGRLFKTWAVATRKARLPTVDSLIGGMTNWLVLADHRARRPGRSATATRSQISRCTAVKKF